MLPAHGEDAESLQGHIINMEKELRKANPNVAYVSDSMSRTLATRRAWITTDHPSVAAIVAKYPAFEHSSFVSIIEGRILKGLCNYFNIKKNS